jgi:glycosyltransferase involved in cell wall biosynthesis
MKRVLVITLLEFMAKPNNRIHQTIRGLQKECDVYLLYRADPDKRKGFARIKNLFPRMTRVFQRDGLHLVEYKPPLNWVENYHFSHESSRRMKGYRDIKSECSNLFGLLREFCFIGYILWTCILRLRKIRFDVCLVETSWEAIAALILRRLGWVRIVVFDNNDYNPGYMQNVLRMKWELFLDKFCVSSSNLLICSGSLLAALWKRETGREAVLIPNGVDLKRFRGQIKTIHKESPTLVYAGNLSSSWMDFEGAFRATRRLLERYPDILFLIVGSESKERMGELRKSVLDLGLSENVIFMGRISHEEIPGVLSRCDIGLATTPSNLLRRYAFPLKVVEYMAVGLPVIVMRNTEAESIVRENNCGLGIGPDEKELTETIERLIEDEELYGEFSRNGLRGSKDMDIDRLTEMRNREIKKVLIRETYPFRQEED